MSGIMTYQDFLRGGGSGNPVFIQQAISDHKASSLYKIALDADEYDHQRNTTITNFVKTLMGSTGERITDISSSNYKIVSNFFRRLNTQRNMYSLGNGITFPDESLKKRLGNTFDTRIKTAGYKALIHGVSFVMLDVGQIHCFTVTEFVPFWDETTGALMAGIRFWQVDKDRPLNAVVYEIDGYTTFASRNDSLIVTAPKRSYKQTVAVSAIDGVEVLSEENYSALPIVPLWGSSLKQSTLVGMQNSIDSYDLIRSGFANDLADCAEVYWIVNNAGGMTEDELNRFRRGLVLRHIAAADADSGVEIKPFVQDIPYAARMEYLKCIRDGIYEAFGGLDVHTVAAGATNDHIDAAYQPLDEQADDYEYQIIECVQRLFALLGMDSESVTPTFKRNRISNVKEQVEIVLMEAPYLDDETILNKLPNISPDEVKDILARKEDAEMKRTENAPPVVPIGDEENTEDEEAAQK